MRLCVLLLAMVCLEASAQQTKWVFESLEKHQAMAASTLNDSGSGFGQLCYTESQKCLYILSLPTACVEGSSYPVLVNADSGSAAYDVICLGVADKGSWWFYFTDFDRIDKSVRASSKIGFAFPLEGDQFRVARFPLAGANAVIDRMRAATVAKQPGAPKNKDQIL